MVDRVVIVMLRQVTHVGMVPGASGRHLQVLQADR